MSNLSAVQANDVKQDPLYVPYAWHSTNAQSLSYDQQQFAQQPQYMVGQNMIATPVLAPQQSAFENAQNHRILLPESSHVLVPQQRAFEYAQNHRILLPESSVELENMKADVAVPQQLAIENIQPQPPVHVVEMNGGAAKPGDARVWTILGRQIPRNRIIGTIVFISILIAVIVVLATIPLSTSSSTASNNLNGICSLSMPAFTITDPGCIKSQTMFSPYYNVNFSSDGGVSWSNGTSVVEVIDINSKVEDFNAFSFSYKVYSKCYTNYMTLNACKSCYSGVFSAWTPAFSVVIPVARAYSGANKLNGQTQVTCSYNGSYYSVYYSK
jgi:hypothetical protein